MRVKALFPAANGGLVGTDVRISGFKVGTVASQRLEPQSYQADVTLALYCTDSVPADSRVAIT